MKWAALLAFVAIGAAAVLQSTPATVVAANCTVDATIDSEEQAFLTLINNHRAQNGLGPLQLSDTLNQAAAWKSKHMADNNYFAHDDTPIGRTWVTRIRDCGYTFNTYLGENIAAGYADATNTFNQWRNSPGHNANMLSANFVAIGIGRAYNANSQYRWYWTTDFGGYADGFTPTPTPAPTPTPLPAPPPASGIDSDGDGCDDAFEGGPNPALGGMRDPGNPWDFFDTPDNANVRDLAISIADVARIVQRFGTTGDPGIDPKSPPPPPPAYHPAFDRTPLGPNNWNVGPPDGAISIQDVALVVAQFGHTCVLSS